MKCTVRKRIKQKTSNYLDPASNNNAAL